jgi:hypothetical protein
MTQSARRSTKEFRQIWMFPRNIRKITPLNTGLILRALIAASERGSSWVGKQGNQDLFAKLLDDYGIKKGGKLRDAGSGGSRTYEAQMRALGLIYKAEDGALKLTQAGEDLANLRNIAETLQYQMMRFQFPAPYSQGPMVNIDPSIKIRPFLFLLQLAGDPELNGLSTKDIAVPVVRGRNHSSFNQCKELILKGREHGLESVITPNDPIWTSRTTGNSYEDRMADILDISNTFKCALEGTGLIQIRYIGNEKRFFPAPGVAGAIAKMAIPPFIDFENLPLFQASLQYGTRIGAVKDTRRIFMPKANPEMLTKSAVILRRFTSTIRLPVYQQEVDQFIEEMKRDFGASRNLVLEAIEPIIQDPEAYIGSSLIDLSKGGSKTAEEFEKTVCHLFDREFGFTADWTGRKPRPGKVGGYMDVFVVETGRNKCGIIDTKSTDSYDLPHDDVAKALSTYIDSAAELYGSATKLELSFVAYISHLISPGAEERARRIYDDKNVPVSLISAYGLNSMRSDNRYLNHPEEVTDRLSLRPVNLIV